MPEQNTASAATAWDAVSSANPTISLPSPFPPSCPLPLRQTRHPMRKLLAAMDKVASKVRRLGSNEPTFSKGAWQP